MTNAIGQIIETIKNGVSPEKIILFGSHAWGKPTAESDLDLLVIKDTSKPYHERLIETRRLLRTTIPIDLLVLTPKELTENSKDNPFISEILSSGQTVYEKIS